MTVSRELAEPSYPLRMQYKENHYGGIQKKKRYGYMALVQELFELANVEL
jgi:hypothetical protein